MDKPFEMDLDPRTPELAAAIEQAAEASREAIIADMQKILTFETVSGGEGEEKKKYCQELDKAFEWIAQRAADLNFEHRDIDGLASVIEQSGDDGSIGVLLHMDVVPPGENWSHPPFSGTLVDGEIHGRGAQDDKGPIVQALHALNILRSMERPFRKSIKLIIGSDEETGIWDSIDRYLDVEAAPDMSIVPDGSFPVVNGEKGLVDLLIKSLPKRNENGPIRVKSCWAGERSNMVPPAAILEMELDDSNSIDVLRQTLAKARSGSDDMSVGLEETPRENGSFMARMTFHGKNAHGSQPWLGHNAARDACRFVSLLPDAGGPRAEFLALLAQLSEDDRAQGLGIANEHDFLGATSQNLGILRIDDKECAAVVNIRQTPDWTAERVLNQARETIVQASRNPDVEVTALGKTYEPLYVDPDDHPEFFRALYSAYKQVTKQPFFLKGLSGTTFAKAFPNAMCFGPTDAEMDEELAHQADERLSVDQLMRNVKIYALAIGLLALGEE